MKGLFLTNRFFYAMAALIGVTMLSYAFPFLLIFSKTGGVVLLVLCAMDVISLFRKSVAVTAERSMAQVLSMGDDNEIHLTIRNMAAISMFMEVIDEQPEQFQDRTFRLIFSLKPSAVRRETYYVRPLFRGEYEFGEVHVFLSTVLGFVRRRTTHALTHTARVYPSIIQMKKYELKTFARTATEYGVKRVRRIGHSYEFDHIKQYIRGDDYRSINWKATGRRAQLMVNQYDDEKSQQVYCIIDKSRVMHMPFNGMSLLDYAVNAALVISNIVLGKQDKAGLITFAESPRAMIKADRSKVQLRKIMETLYNEEEGTEEANYEGLYMAVRKIVTGRSLLFLYTNFETSYALQRVLPQLRRLNDQHVLVVVMFENTEVTASTSMDVQTMEDVYQQITAEDFILTKVQLAQQLRQFGIISILTKPENLTVSTINKYLELKSRGVI